MTLRTFAPTAPALALAAALLAGCAVQETPRPFGQAYTEQFQQQIVGEPYAAPTPVEGLDGQQARRAVEALRNPEQDKSPSFTQVLESLVDRK